MRLLARPPWGHASTTSTAQGRRTVHYHWSTVGHRISPRGASERRVSLTAEPRQYPIHRVVIVNRACAAGPRAVAENRLTVPARFDRLPCTTDAGEAPQRREQEVEVSLSHAPDIAPGRLPADAYARNFADLHPQLGPREARVAAERCLFCYDAPCVQACPTSIDIPLFIRQIATGNPLGSAKTILDSNIMGGMCARVCPTETLCEQVCVREIAEGKPVEIGRLQRYATDALFASGPPALPPGHRHRAQGGRGRRRARRARLRPQARHPRPRRHRPRGPREARRPQRVRHRRLQDRGRLRAGRGRLDPGRGRDRAAYRRAPRPRRGPGRPAPRLRRRVPGPGPGRRERAGPGRGGAGRRHGRGRLHRGPAPGARPRQPAGRPPHRRHRRRHDRDRHRQPDQAPGCGGRHHRLPPRPRADGRLGLRAGARPDRRRPSAPLAAAAAPPGRGRQAHRRRARLHRRPHRDPDPALRPAVQGDRPGLPAGRSRRLARGGRADRRPHRRRRRAPHLDRGRLGRRRLRRRRQGPHRRRGRGRQAGGAVDRSHLRAAIGARAA